MYLTILFIFPLLINAKITVNITVNSNKPDVLIKYSGFDFKIVTDKEIKLFNVTTEQLNKGMRVEMGKAPDDIFFKDPTVYGTLYKNYNWEPVKRSLKVHKSKIIDVINEDVLLETHEFINNSTQTIKYKRRFREVVENTAHSIWLPEGILEDEITYDLNLNFNYGNFKYENKWRQNKVHSSRMAINISKEGPIFVKPNQAIVTKLSATKTILLIELEYKAKLVGDAVANFAELYGKYHFWAPSMESIMKAAKMKNEILTREQIEIVGYVNPRLDLHDKLTGEKLEPPKKKRPKTKLLRNQNTTRVLHTRIKKKQKEPINIDDLKLCP